MSESQLYTCHVCHNYLANMQFVETTGLSFRKAISDSLSATHPRFGHVCYRKVERQNLPLGSTVCIARSCRPSPALISLLMRRVNEHHQPWSCSKSLLVQMSDSSYATASRIALQQRSYFCHVPCIRNNNRMLYRDSVRRTYRINIIWTWGPSKIAKFGARSGLPQ